MPVALNGSTSGSVTLTAPAVAGTNTLTLPAVTDTLVGLAATQTLTGKTLTSPTITGAVVSSMGSSVLTSATAQASTSGTSIDFTGIPSWVKRITVMFSGVSTSGSSNPLIQLGTSSGVTITGYLSYSCRISATAVAGGGNTTTGFAISSVSLSNILSGSIVCSLLNNNIWAVNGFIAETSNGFGFPVSGAITLSSTLDRLRITTVVGTDTFDAGTINIMYE
jgi:hypothetical protein